MAAPLSNPRFIYIWTAFYLRVCKDESIWMVETIRNAESAHGSLLPSNGRFCTWKKSNKNEIQTKEKDQEDIKSIDKDQEIIKETKNCTKKTNTLQNQED